MIHTLDYLSFLSKTPVLISSSKTRENETEWKNLDRLESLPTKLDDKLPSKSNEIDAIVLDEYDKFFKTITTEYARQIEIFYRLQRPNSNIFFNSVSMSYNFFQLSFDMYNKLADHFTRNY